MYENRAVLTWKIKLRYFNGKCVEFILAIVVFVPERIEDVVVTKIICLSGTTDYKNE